MAWPKKEPSNREPKKLNNVALSKISNDNCCPKKARSFYSRKFTKMIFTKKIDTMKKKVLASTCETAPIAFSVST